MQPCLNDCGAAIASGLDHLVIIVQHMDAVGNSDRHQDYRQDKGDNRYGNIKDSH